MHNVSLFVGAFLVLLFVVLSSASQAISISQQCPSDQFLLSASLSCSKDGETDILSRITDESPANPGSTETEQEYYAEYAPWSYVPVCTTVLGTEDSQLCVYTNKSFHGGRGISVFTTPQIAEVFAALPPFHDAPTLEGVNLPDGPWYTEQIPGKGIGMLAEHDLKYGDLITAYTPVLLAYPESTLSIEERERYFRLAVDQLPHATRDAYYNLSTIYGIPEVIAQDVVKGNAFEIQIAGVMHVALFPEPSRINHDCSPNAQYHLDADRLTHYVHATRPIRKDEEITISYTNPLDPHSTRHEKLLSAFHFTCTCPRCLRPSTSDETLIKISTLQSHLADWSAHSSVTPATALRLIQLHQEESLEGFLGTAYGYAALAYNAIGDEVRAVEFANLAERAIALKDGEGSPDLGMVRELMGDPRGHWSWRWRV